MVPAIKNFGQRRRPRGTLLASVLLAHCAAVGRAGTPNSWSTVALSDSGACPGKLVFSGTAASKGLVYVFGGKPDGLNSNVDSTNWLTEIDPATGVCTRLDDNAEPPVKGNPPSKRWAMGLSALDGVLWVFGGYDGSSNHQDLHAFTIATRTWRKVVAADAPSARGYMGFSAGAGGLLVTYGKNGGNPRDAHFFDVATEKWQALPSPPAAGGLVQANDRYGHGQAMLNGTAFVFGGFSAVKGQYLHDLLTLNLGDPDAQWVAVNAQGDVPGGQYAGALVAVGQQLLYYGGYDDSVGYSSDVTMFDPSTDQWTEVTGFMGTTPAARASFGGAAVIGCSVFIYGGEILSDTSDELIRYEADEAVTSCPCPLQCKQIVADTHTIDYETNTTVYVRLHHPYEV